MNTEPNQLAFARASFYHHDGGYDSPQEGLTKREYFAAHADIPWNAVLETLNAKFPERNGKFSIAEFLEYQVSVKVLAADKLIEALNKQP